MSQKREPCRGLGRRRCAVTQPDSLVPLGFERRHPGGMAENSPAFQRRDKGERASSPEGTVEMIRLSRPFGTYASRTSDPALKRRATVVCPSGTKTAFVSSNPSDIGPTHRAQIGFHKSPGTANNETRHGNRSAR